MSLVSRNKRRLRMKYRILCVSVLFAFVVAMASAQSKNSISGKCAKPDVTHSVPAGDQPGHAFSLAQGKCSSKGEVGGAMSKEGAFSEEIEAFPDRMKNWGVYVETFDSGDKVFYCYETNGTMKDGAFQSGMNKYVITGGTGKMKGIKGKGTCKLTGSTDGGVDYSCEGEYMLAAAAAVKK